MSKATTTETITLDTPVKRESGDITSVELRKPNSGELRGLSLAELLQMDVDSLTKLLPRVTTPILHEADIRAMDPADLVQLGGKVSNFLLPKSIQG